MAILVLGLTIFLGFHLLPVQQTIRGNLVSKFGELPYKALFSVGSIAGFYLIVVGKAQAPFISVWMPPSFFKHITMLLVLLAFVILPAAYISSNIKRKLKNPMLIAVKLWALGHLLANGDVASLILFGSFLAYAVIDMISVKKRGQTITNDPQPIWKDALVVVIGLAAYMLVVMNHASLFGVPVIQVGG